MDILICGGGNAAHTLAGLLAAQAGQAVRIFLSLPEEARRWQSGLAEQGGIRVRLPEGEVYGRPQAASADPAEVVPGAGLALLALPAFAHEDVLRQIAPYLSAGAWVGALPARGGFDFCAHDALGLSARHVSIFGLQTLPWACRIEEYGRSARVLGAKAEVDLAARPAAHAADIAAELSRLLGLRVTPGANFLSLTLAGTGQIIHPGIQYGLFHHWDGSPYSEAPLFYQGVTPEIASLLQAMSDEVQSLRHALESRAPGLELETVRPLGEWLQRAYGDDIADPSSLERAFVSNRAYAGLRAPMRPVPGGLAPDFQARYLSEDVPYALLATRGVAELVQVPTPWIDRVISWAQQQLGREYLSGGRLQGKDLSASRAPQRYGCRSLETLLAADRYTYPA